ncbi:hypothetical protein EVAR_32965_1 [Eumeta japonica]|uniref:Uncharacterized protein n=1 Tax=Eumeta variegata TaxID=151549 RepID=A0A4C1WXT9_EUMVA|nr:hypothetical protein EVAR_32965_1 [Eumeta japonica]
MNSAGIRIERGREIGVSNKLSHFNNTFYVRKDEIAGVKFALQIAFTWSFARIVTEQYLHLICLNPIRKFKIPRLLYDIKFSKTAQTATAPLPPRGEQGAIIEGSRDHPAPASRSERCA